MSLIVLGILVFVVIVLIGALALIALIFSRTIQRVADHADRVHDRSVDQLQDVLDRLMAKNIEEYKVYSLGEEGHGEVLYPPETNDRPWNVPGVFRRGLAGGLVQVGEEDENE